MSRYLTLGLFLIIAACGSKTPPELQLLHDGVMEIHDEVMPKMRDINQAKKALLKLDNAEEDPAIQQLLTRLEDADEGMMEWMAQFKKPDGTDLGAARAYYVRQKKSIEKVRTEMLDVLKASQDMVDQKQSNQ